MARNFRNIKAWVLADDLAVLVYAITRDYPKEERFGLVPQMRRAAVSVPSNIAEGSGRRTNRDYLRFLYIAMASLSELEYYLHISERLNYLIEEQYSQLKKAQKETAYTLNGLLKSVEDQTRDELN